MTIRLRAMIACVASLALAHCADSPPNDDPATDAGPDALDASDTADATDASGTDASDDVDADSADGAGTDADDDALAPTPSALRAPTWAIAGEPATIEVDLASDVVGYTLTFGDGEEVELDATTTAIEHVWMQPGRLRPSLTTRDARGTTESFVALVTVTWPAVHTPAQATDVAVRRSDGAVAVVEPDADLLTRFSLGEDGALNVVSRTPVCAHPRTVASLDTGFAVACQDDDRVCIVRDDATVECTELDHGSRPYGVIAAGGRLLVTLQARGEVVALDPADLTVRDRWAVIEDARGIATLPDGGVAVTRWRSPDQRAEIARLDLTTGAVTPWTLAFVDRLASDTETGGVPTYLDAFAVSPSGRYAVVPSTLANIGQGLAFNGEPLTHETTVRAVLSTVNLPEGTEAPASRVQFDDRGLAIAAVFSQRGDYLFVAHRGARAVDRIDALTGNGAGTLIDVGYAPTGLALVDDRFLLVHASLARELRVYDVSSFSTLPVAISTATTVDTEPLRPDELRGAQLFNDSFDTRLAKDGYIACAHCHLDAEADHRTWDFTDRGEGVRNTITLRGRRGDGQGPIHWSGNFDEIHDFEHDIRGPFRGTGLIDDAVFFADDHDRSLGASKAGLSDDLDALAAWVATLDTVPRSPHRASDGSLTDAARRGQTLFFDDGTGCATCHAGTAMTDSAFLEPERPLLHDVGTLTEASGMRLSGPLEGIDTPTLIGTWNTGPWLHDGSAATLRDVLVARNPDDQHGTTSTLSEGDVDDLVAFLLSLEGAADELP